MTHRTHARELDAQALLSEDQVRQFWAKVDTSGGSTSCWPWTAALAVNGYGVFGVGQKVDGRWRNNQQKAHRLAWSLTNGSIASGLVVRHTCDNPPCCNPAHHLLIGSDDDNVADKVARNRQARGAGHSRIMQALIARGERNGNARLTEDSVRAMRADFAAGVSVEQLAAKYGVSHPTAYRVTHRRSWRHI